MFGNKATGTITFYYDSDVLFNDVCMTSSFMAKGLSDGEGTLLDKFAITDDEKDAYKACVKKALPNVYELMVKLSYGITDAYSPEVVVKEQETDVLKRAKGTYIEVNVADNKAYNGTALTLVDNALSSSLLYAVISEFYTMNLNADLYKIAQNRLNDNLSVLSRRLFQLKKKPVSPLI